MQLCLTIFTFAATKCPSTILNGTFESSCTYNNSETCRYNCNHGYEPTVAGSSLTCTLGSWNNNKPCEKIGLKTFDMYNR